MNSLGKVLIVDDTPANLSFLSDALDQAGYMVLIAMSGETALRQIAVLKPDVILLDAVMPGLDGFATCEALKSASHSRDIPIIFMTALDDTEAVVRAFQAGAVDYLTKPIRQQELLARIVTHVRQARLVSVARQAMDESGRAGLIVDREGKILWHTPQAATYLAGLSAYSDENMESLPQPLLEWFTRRAGGERGAATPNTFQLVTTIGRLVVHRAGEINVGENLLLIEQQQQELSETSLREFFDLTQREAQVLLWVTRGKTNFDIATILGMSVRTVSKHLEHVFSKLGVETRTAAAARVVQKCSAPIY